ncbi:MAG TPA: CHASE3 domain-containing protein, partial [Herbaspirillum sp.]
MSLSTSVPRFFTATGFSFVVALLLSIAVAIYSMHNVREFQNAETWINQTQATMQKLEEALSTVKDLVGAAHGYALTGQSEYLDRYQAAREALPPMMAIIGAHIEDNAQQMQRKAALTALLTRRIEMAQEQIKRDPHSQAAIFGYGHEVTNQIRTKFDEMKLAESRLLAQRASDSERRALRTRYAIVGGNLLSCTIMIWVFIRLRREMHKRHVAQLQAQASAGESEALSRTVLDDVAALKHNESKIENLNIALRNRAAQLELANKELEGFSYSVSHDLRAPLRLIGGYAMMLEEDYAEKFDEDGKRYLNVIHANTRKMDALIIDLLKLAKSTLAPLTLATVDMRRLVQKAIAGLELEHDAAIDIGPLCNADANAALLLQVWENLLANAVKFSRNHAQPAIVVDSERTEQEIVYRVRDNGVGLDIAQASKLFEVFQRFHSQEEFPGAGVGLALVKRIVLRHGGRVWAESRPGA